MLIIVILLALNIHQLWYHSWSNTFSIIAIPVQLNGSKVAAAVKDLGEMMIINAKSWPIGRKCLLYQI